MKQDADTQVKGAYGEATRGAQHSEASQASPRAQHTEPRGAADSAPYREGGDRQAAYRHRHNLPTCETTSGTYAEQTTGASSTISSSISYTSSNSYNHDIIEHHIKASIPRHTERGGGRARCLSSVYASGSRVLASRARGVSLECMHAALESIDL
jgi:hypothetical protein